MRNRMGLTMRLTVLFLVGGTSAMLIADQPESIRITETELWQALDLTRPGPAPLRGACATILTRFPVSPSILPYISLHGRKAIPYQFQARGLGFHWRKLN